MLFDVPVGILGTPGFPVALGSERDIGTAHAVSGVNLKSVECSSVRRNKIRRFNVCIISRVS